MRYLGPLAVFAASVAVGWETSIGVLPVLGFLYGFLLAILPPVLPLGRGQTIGYGIIFLVPFFFPYALPYLPAAVYWLEHEEADRLLILFALPGLISGFLTDPRTAVQTAILGVLAALLGSLARQQRDTEADVLSRMDRERTERIRAEADKRAGAAEAEKEVRIATLAERNRIARDLHDTIGHVLSSALLQTTALLTTEKDEQNKAAIRDLQTTLNHGMDRARQSVHSLYEESLSFEYELKKMTDQFTFCGTESEVFFTEEPTHDTRQTMLKAAAEALTNVTRHSDASLVRISAVEHPAFYRLHIKDNGTRVLSELEETSRGGVHLGLNTMAERARRTGGSLRIERRDGFGIILTLPKERRGGVSE